MCSWLCINMPALSLNQHSPHIKASAYSAMTVLTNWGRFVSIAAGRFFGHLACLSNLEDLQLGKTFDFEFCYKNQPPDYRWTPRNCSSFIHWRDWDLWQAGFPHFLFFSSVSLRSGWNPKRAVDWVTAICIRQQSESQMPALPVYPCWNVMQNKQGIQEFMAQLCYPKHASFSQVVDCCSRWLRVLWCAEIGLQRCGRCSKWTKFSFKLHHLGTILGVHCIGDLCPNRCPLAFIPMQELAENCRFIFTTG